MESITTSMKKYWQFQMPEMPAQLSDVLSHARHLDPAGLLVPASPMAPARRPHPSETSPAETSPAAPSPQVPATANPHAARKRGVSARTLPACLKCGTKSLKPSGVKDLKEDFLAAVGATFYRCQRCEERYTKVFRRLVRIQEPRESKSHRLVFAAIAAGFLCCLAVALYAQRVAHRWPF